VLHVGGGLSHCVTRWRKIVLHVGGRLSHCVTRWRKTGASSIEQDLRELLTVNLSDQYLSATFFRNAIATDHIIQQAKHMPANGERGFITEEKLRQGRSRKGSFLTERRQKSTPFIQKSCRPRTWKNTNNQTQ